LIVAVSIVILAIVGVFWRLAGDTVSAPQWAGTLLNGPSVANNPRLSPDGRTLAFLALVDNLSQVAVMNPDSGNWTVLTKDRSRGSSIDMCWSRDGSRIYFDRYDNVPRGIFSVPALGGEERLILEDAMAPESLHRGTQAWYIWLSC